MSTVKRLRRSVQKLLPRALRDSPTGQLASDVVVGISQSQSVLLSEIGRTMDEDRPLIDTVRDLSEALREEESAVAYVLPETISFEGMIDYTVGVAAGLKAIPELVPLAAPWDARKLALRAARDARDDARATVIECAKVVEVRDTIWDAAVITLSGRAYSAAGKDASRSPYAPLFGTVTASQATKLGPTKATVYGNNLIAKGTALAHPDLDSAVKAAAAANKPLADAGTARTAAQADALTHEIKRIQARDALEQLIAETELGILQKFLGRDDLVRAILAPPRKTPARRGPGGEGEEGGEEK